MSGSCLEVEEIAQAACLRTAHGDLSILAVVHAELIAGLEPRNDLADVLDVDDVRAVRTPELIRIELIHQFLERAHVGFAVEGFGHDRDAALVNRGEADIALINEQETALRLHHDLTRAA